MFNVSVLDYNHGHLPLTWDPRDEKGVALARADFNRLKSLGYIFYETKKLEKGGGVTTEVVHDFDALHASYTAMSPEEEVAPPRELTARPPIAGG